MVEALDRPVKLLDERYQECFTHSALCSCASFESLCRHCECKCEDSVRAKLYKYLRQSPFFSFRESPSGGSLNASCSPKITSDNGSPVLYVILVKRRRLTLGVVHFRSLSDGFQFRYMPELSRKMRVSHRPKITSSSPHIYNQPAQVPGR
jgi:hypothetical protein